MLTVAFTGYRPDKMPFGESENDESYLAFRASLSAVILRLLERGATHFISGVAMGFDTWAAEEILHEKAKNPSLTLECAIPFPKQADAWQKADKARREKILKSADSFVTLSESYTKECFFVRNRYMVDKADVVVCAYDGQSGGTAYTLSYALEKKKIVIRIDPRTARVSLVGESRFEI
jgi:uncharacterized phage-like protein YoqJ